MFRKTLIARIVFVTLAATGGAAFADDITQVEDRFVTTKTRAEVQAEVLAARVAGTLGTSEIDLSPTMPQAARSMLAREQVRAELRAAPRVPAIQFNPAA